MVCADDADDSPEEKPSLPEQATEKFGEWLTTTYSNFQGKAGETVGVEPGAAWHAAVQAASEHGVSQVSLPCRQGQKR